MTASRVALGLLGVALWLFQRAITTVDRPECLATVETVVAAGAYVLGACLMFIAAFLPRLRREKTIQSADDAVTQVAPVHARAAAAALVIYGLMYMLGASLLAWIQQDDDPALGAAFTSVLGSLAGATFVYLVLGAGLIILGSGLLAQQTWARRGSIAAGFVMAIQFPVGVLFAFYIWWSFVGRTFQTRATRGPVPPPSSR